jgi:peptide/nickel transport system permease protein
MIRAALQRAGSGSRLRMDLRTLWVSATVVVVAVLMFFPGLIAPADPLQLEAANRFQPPSLTHLFGTDEAGRDLFSRVVYGARPSLGTALAVVTFAGLVGTLIGAIAGWLGGWPDRAIMRVVDVILAFPYLVMAMAVAAALGRGMAAAMAALALVWWPSYARMVRGMVLSLKQDLHVRAGRTLGASDLQLLRWHVVPHTFQQLNVRFTLDTGYAVIALTGLSFLGLGAQNPSPEWGLMIANARTFVFSAWWYGFFPGVAIFLTVLNFVGLGDLLAKERP